MANLLFILIQTCIFISLILISTYILEKVNLKNTVSNKLLYLINRDISKININSISLKKQKLITPLSLVLFSAFCFILAFVISYSFLKLFVSSLIISKDSPFNKFIYNTMMLKVILITI